MILIKNDNRHKQIIMILFAGGIIQIRLKDDFFSLLYSLKQVFMKYNLYFLRQIRKQSGVIIFTTLLLCFTSTPPAWSQNVIAPGTTFKVGPGTTVMSGENLVVKNGALVSNAGTLVLKKGLTNEYAVPNSLGTGAAEFSGVANQSILGQNIFQNLTVNNATGITIGGNTSVYGILTLTAGKVALGSNNLLLGPSSTVAGSPSATAMIVATGIGELRREFISGFAGSFTWPVGDATATAEYSPVTLTFTGGTFGTNNYAGVKLVNAKYPDPAITGNYLNRYWTLTQNGITNPLHNALFQYVPADVVGSENQISCLRVDPPPFVTYSPANINLHQLAANALTSAGTFTGGQVAVTCTLSVTPSNQNVPASPAGSTSFSVTSNCAWTAVSDQTWCNVTPSGNSNGTITANYGINPTTSPRTANITVTVAGLSPVTITVTQAAAPCTLSVTPPNQNVPASPAGSTSFSVTSNCAWTAVSDQTWCTVTPSGNGNGTITANYGINPTTSPRTANITVTVAGLSPVTVTVTQAAAPCTLSVTPPNQNVPASPAGSTSFSVTSNCAWTAVSDQTWCTVTPSGNGNGTITANYGINPITSPRTANITVTVAGLSPIVVTVTQAAAPCTLSVTPANQNVTNAAGAATFAVTSTAGCNWIALSNQTWCTVTPSGSGNGSIIATCLQNTGSTRTATITVTVPGVNPVMVTVTQAPGSCLVPWQPIQNQQYNMNVIAKLYLSNVLTTNPADAIGAFVGQECRGIAYPDPVLNGILFLTISSNLQSGETVTFKAWKSATCEECPVAETMPFVNQSEVGTVNNPFEFHCGLVELCVSFGVGYTWFSVNVNPGSMSLNSLFSNIAPCENDRIIGQQSFATYYGTQWVGSLSSIDPTAMYKMKLCSQQTWCKQGLPVNITPMTIASGYPWIGYLPQSDLPINTALAGIVPAPVSNDRFNGQSSFATFTGTQWVGSLATLQKGKGYIIHLANPSILTYPTGLDNPGTTIENPAIAIASPTGDNPKANARYNMQLIASIILPDGSTSVNAGDVVLAYVGNECRGMANPVPELLGRLFLSVGSDIESGEELTFKVFLSDENQLYDVSNNMAFSSEMEVGMMANPYEFNLSGLTGIPIVAKGSGIRVGEVYPNPFDATASIEIGIDKTGKVEGRIINGVGNVIRVVMNKELEAGSYVLKLNGEDLPPGLYTLLMTYSNDQTRWVVSKKMIIK